MVRRLSGRRTCTACGANLHVDFSPPRAEGRCDTCGGKLGRRDDDNEDSIRTRLHEYRMKTAPLAGHYSELGLLRVVDGAGLVEEVTQRVVAALEGS